MLKIRKTIVLLAISVVVTSLIVFLLPPDWKNIFFLGVNWIDVDETLKKGTFLSVAILLLSAVANILKITEFVRNLRKEAKPPPQSQPKSVQTSNVPQLHMEKPNIGRDLVNAQQVTINNYNIPEPSRSSSTQPCENSSEKSSEDPSTPAYSGIGAQAASLETTTHPIEETESYLKIQSLQWQDFIDRTTEVSGRDAAMRQLQLLLREIKTSLKAAESPSRGEFYESNNWSSFLRALDNLRTFQASNSTAANRIRLDLIGELGRVIEYAAEDQLIHSRWRRCIELCNALLLLTPNHPGALQMLQQAISSDDTP